MVTLDEGNINISIPGDAEDLITIQESILYMLGNQNEETMPNAEQLFAISRLLQAMLPNERQLKKALKAA